MAKKKGGLPAGIIKEYGITKKAWRVYRGQGARKTTKAISKPTKSKRRRTMARRRRKTRRKPSYTRKFDQSMRVVTRLAPYGLSFTGTHNLGYSVVDEAMAGNWNGAINALFTDVLMLHTGYNVRTGGFHWNALGVNLLAQIDVIGSIKRMVNRFTKIF